jgi:hypothetical protein
MSQNMMGSGIYSETATREIVCKEQCWDCIDIKQVCEASFEVDFETDDWGNIEQEVTCEKCGHGFTYKEERDR